MGSGGRDVGARIAAVAATLIVAVSASGQEPPEREDPATWDEWLLPRGDYVAGQPQGAACRLFVREVGEGSRIVFLHGGWGGEHAGLLHGFLPLADRHRLVFYDQRASLRSPCPGTPTVSDHVADLEALREALGEERLVLVGHSMGGYLAMAYAEAHPDRVAGLVLMGSVPAREADYARDVEARWERPEVLAELERHGLELSRRPDDTPQEWAINHRIVFAAVNLHDVTKWREVRVPWFFSQQGAEAAESMADEYDFTAALSGVGAEILVLHGDDDFLSLEGVERSVAAVPNARLHVVADAGHMAWVDRPREVLEAVERYVTGLE